VQALKKYGKDIADQEFLLRRLTTISVQILALISMIRKIDMMNQNEREKTGSIEALHYLLSESEMIVKDSNRLTPEKNEIQQKTIVKFLRDSLKSEIR